MAEQNLLQVDTNSADDSKGMAFGLSGNLFLFVIGGGIVSVMLALLFTAVMKIDLLFGTVLASAPFLMSSTYAVLFLNNRPPHYRDDLFHAAIGEDCVEPARRQRPNPLDSSKVV